MKISTEFVKCALLLSFGVFGMALHSAFPQSNELAFSRSLADWYTVPPDLVERIWSDPSIGNVYNWQVRSDSGKPTPYLKVLVDLEKGTQCWQTQEVDDGLIVALLTGRILWYSFERIDHQILGFGWINQFQRAHDSNEIYAAAGEWNSDSGQVLRFSRVGDRWSVNPVVDFGFGEVYGVDPNFAGGTLVYSENGWFLIQQDRQVISVADQGHSLGNGVSIASAGSLIYIGGEFFIKEFNLETKRIRVLLPSKKFLDAILEWPSERFNAARNFAAENSPPTRGRR